MAQVDDILESIRLKEDQNLYALTTLRLFNSSYIWRTSELAVPKLIITGIAYKIFKPSIIMKTLATCTLVLFWLLFATALSSAEKNIGVLLFGTIYTIAAAKYINLIDFDKSRNFNILVDKQGIITGEKVYKWSDMRATAILYLPTLLNGTYYLIILHEDDGYEKYNLSNFYSAGGFRKKLATYIEFFKIYA